MTIRRGDVVRHELAGPGGWGDPLERDPAEVADDVVNDKVSRDAARDLYGVVVGADGTADVDATTDLRDQRRGT
jgi:N-methylhydantoinase B